MSKKSKRIKVPPELENLVKQLKLANLELKNKRSDLALMKEDIALGKMEMLYHSSVIPSKEKIKALSDEIKVLKSKQTKLNDEFQSKMSKIMMKKQSSEIDPFDEEKYGEIYTIYKKHFNKLDTYIYAPDTIFYVFEYLKDHPKDQERFLNNITKGDPKQYLKELSSLGDTRKWINAFYRHYNPQIELDIDGLLTKYHVWKNFLWLKCSKNMVS